MSSAGTREGVYLDHAATSPLLPEALEAMLPFFGAAYANPSSAHRGARQVRREIDDARECLASLFGCEPAEVVFTSGGTEADNLAVKGALGARRGLVVTSAVEHHAVLHAAAGFEARLAEVDEEGRVDPVRFAALLDDAVVLVSLMAANNETGVLQPLAELAACVERLAPAALFHTDAVQAFSCLDPTSFAEADLVSFSAHKFGGPKGIGALVVRARARPLLRALLEGGAQEHELRAGTENVPGIIGMAAAARVVAAARDRDRVKVAALRDRLAAGLAATVPGVRESGRSVERIASICHVVFPNVAAEELLLLLDEAGIAASAGAACASGALEPSHVLLAMGRSAEESKRAVRFSLGPETSVADIDRTVIAVGEAVGRLTAVHDAGEN